MRGRVMAARDRLRDTLHNSADRRLTARNTIVEALARFVEARTDSYPDLAEIGKLASALGAGSPEAFFTVKYLPLNRTKQSHPFGRADARP